MDISEHAHYAAEQYRAHLATHFGLGVAASTPYHKRLIQRAIDAATAEKDERIKILQGILIELRDNWRNMADAVDSALAGEEE